MGGGSFGILLEAGTDYQAIVSEGNKNISHFRQKYKGKVCHSLDIDLNHPFLIELKSAFDKHIIGQQQAKDYLSEAVLDSVLRVGDIKGPLGVFFFHGPTGVGKTEIVKSLAETMFGNSNGFIKVDCEHLMEFHKGSTLFGAPPGFLGSDKIPRLNNKSIMLAYDVAKQTKKLNKIINTLPWFNILLFDEIEKAHPDIIQQFLSLIDEGKVVTSNGEVVNFENSIIIFTSNIGQKEIISLKNKNTIGFSSSGEIDKTDLSKQFNKSLKDKLSPEFIGRIHNFVEFNELNINDCKDIIDVQINNLNDYLLKYFTESHIQFELSPNVYDFIIKKGYSKEKGARELVRAFNVFLRRYINRTLHSDKFKKYFDYDGEVLLGIDIDNEDKLFSEIILDGKDGFSKEIKLLENKEENKQKLSLEKLNKIYEIMSIYVELTYINLDGDIGHNSK